MAERDEPGLVRCQKSHPSSQEMQNARSPPGAAVQPLFTQDGYFRANGRRRRMDLTAAERRLINEFEGIFSPETVVEAVSEAAGQVADAPVQTHVATLAERLARERLRAVAQVEGRIMKEVPEVLFVCVHNAGRSQMAAALLEHYAGGRVHVRSAGSTPADEINPAAVAAMREVKIDVSKEFPKELTTEIVEAADVVITMGCGDACPLFPGKRYLDWDLPDPAGKPVEVIRPIRDEIDRRVRDLLDTLVPSGA